MFERIHNEEERGQVGIGTLIVFIAMVLVAAIAAGVLINTAGFLQTQAEATGEESTSQVVDRIEVQSATGQVADVDSLSSPTELVESGEGAETVIYGVDLTVTKAPGANDVDLDDVTVELVTDDGVNQVVLEDGVDPVDEDPASDNEGVFIDTVTAESEDDNVLTDSSDRYTISLAGYAIDDTTDSEDFYSFEENLDFSNDLNVDDDDQTWVGNLEGGDSMEVRLTTAAGATTTEEVRVPDSLVDRDAVSL